MAFSGQQRWLSNGISRLDLEVNNDAKKPPPEVVNSCECLWQWWRADINTESLEKAWWREGESGSYPVLVHPSGYVIFWIFVVIVVVSQIEGDAERGQKRRECFCQCAVADVPVLGELLAWCPLQACLRGSGWRNLMVCFPFGYYYPASASLASGSAWEALLAKHTF